MDHARKGRLLVKMKPSAEAQLQFLQHLQRLFEEGDFVATYKFALLMSLAEIAVESSDEDLMSGVSMTRIAEKFAELYWPQTLPYISEVQGAAPDLLLQNQGKQAAVINALVALRSAGASTLRQAMLLTSWPDTVRRIARIVSDMPIKYLQNIGGRQIAFLYDYPIKAGYLAFKPGVVFMLRNFHPLVQQLARAGWVRHVRENRRNANVIGKVDALEEFMFGGTRTALAPVATFLDKLQSSRCFYCGERINRVGDVDHFIPWSKYPRDLAHNFVLAHPECNRRKSDMLGAERHLYHWLDRNRRYGEEIEGHFPGFFADVKCAIRVATWAYEQAIACSAHGWVEKRLTEALSANCVDALRSMA